MTWDGLRRLALLAKLLQKTPTGLELPPFAGLAKRIRTACKRGCH